MRICLGIRLPPSRRHRRPCVCVTPPSAHRPRGRSGGDKEAGKIGEGSGGAAAAVTMEPDETRLEALPDEILQLILGRCSARDVCAAAGTCRRLRAVARGDAVWRQRCLEDFGLCRSKLELERGNDGRLHDARWRARCGGGTAPPAEAATWRGRYMLCARAIRGSAGGVLFYKGVATDGGCDGTEVLSDDLGPRAQREGAAAGAPSTSSPPAAGADLLCSSRYWVDNMFAPTHWDSYCSQASGNIHCFAFLQRESAHVDEDMKEFRRYLLTRTYHAATTLYGDEVRDLHLWSTMELEVFLTELFLLYVRGHAIGKLLFAGVRDQAELEAEVRRARAYVEMIEKARRGPSIRVVAVGGGDLTVLAMPEVASPVGAGAIEVSLIKRINISRVGQFSCPVSCGAVLVGCATRGSEAETANLIAAARAGRCAALESLTTADEVTAASAAGRLPPVRSFSSTSSGQIIEFRAQAGAPTAAAPAMLDVLELRPLVWFRFTDKEQAKREAARAGTDAESLDQMAITLDRHHAANVLCVKLISAENLMDEFDDVHESPNIDINGCTVSGVRLSMDMSE